MSAPTLECICTDDDECCGCCIEYPHKWTYGDGKFYSPVCQRSGCNVMGTGDRCGDGECEGHPDYPQDEEDDTWASEQQAAYDDHWRL